MQVLGKTYAPVEPKVQAAGLASYGAVAVLLGLLNIVQDERHALILGTLPEWVETLLLPVLPAATTWAVAWLARHQYRDGEVTTTTPRGGYLNGE